MPAELIAPALAGGNAVVWNPASSTSICGVRLAECLVEAGFPPGVVNLVTGSGAEVGDTIVESPDVQVISFTGSSANGKRIAERAGDHADRPTLPAWGSWSEGSVTFDGRWCAPLSVDLVRRLNKALAEAKRAGAEERAASTGGSRWSGAGCS